MCVCESEGAEPSRDETANYKNFFILLLTLFLFSFFFCFVFSFIYLFIYFSSVDGRTDGGRFIHNKSEKCAQTMSSKSQRIRIRREWLLLLPPPLGSPKSLHPSFIVSLFFSFFFFFFSGAVCCVCPCPVIDSNRRRTYVDVDEEEEEKAIEMQIDEAVPSVDCKRTDC